MAWLRRMRAGARRRRRGGAGSADRSPGDRRQPAMPGRATCSFGSECPDVGQGGHPPDLCRSEEHTSELQSLMRISYAVFCLKKKTDTHRKSDRSSQHTTQYTHYVLTHTHNIKTKNT